MFILLNSPLGISFLLEKAPFPLLSRGVNPGAEGRDPQILGRGVTGWAAEGSLESWAGREILLYLIMYRKYARKWLLLKRNRIISPEVAVNGQFFAWKIEFFNCLKKSKFSEICLQNSIFFCKLPEKIEFFRKFACRNRN